MDEVTHKLSKQSFQIKYFYVRHSQFPILYNDFFMDLDINHLSFFNSKVHSLEVFSLTAQGNTLRHLLLAKNDLEDVPTLALLHLKHLLVLNLNDNRIQILESAAFSSLQRLAKLTLFRNEIRKMEKGAFQGLQSLHHLNLGRNKLKAIEDGVFAELTTLVFLDLSHNQIQTITPSNFQGLVSLNWLSLAFNRMPNVSENTFEPLLHLTSLYLDYNQLHHLHNKSLQALQESLELLSLAGNILRQVPTTALYPLHSLVILYLNNNRIEHINQHDFPAKVGHNLKDLWLQNNIIHRIHPKAFTNLSRIHWIKLSNNLLENDLDYDLIEPTLSTLQCIDMHSNPLRCTCQLDWTRSFVVSEYCLNHRVHQVYCRADEDRQQHEVLQYLDTNCIQITTLKPKPTQESIERSGTAGTVTGGKQMALLVMLCCVLLLQNYCYQSITATGIFYMTPILLEEK
eukprot:06834.XXX_231629_228369_1 [CDS] Oithona nana genome sequencing.